MVCVCVCVCVCVSVADFLCFVHLVNQQLCVTCIHSSSYLLIEIALLAYIVNYLHGVCMCQRVNMMVW